MKQKIQAGRELEVATPKEVADAIASGLKSWQSEAVIGARFPRFTAQGLVSAGVLSIDGNAGGGERLGPDAGFIWDVRRLRVSGMGGADSVGIYINDVSQTSKVATTKDNATESGTGGTFLWDRQLVLNPGDSILIYGSNLLATTGTVVVSGQVLEIPVSQQWRLIG